MIRFRGRMRAGVAMTAAAWLVVAMPVLAQVRTVDPDQPIDGDLGNAPGRQEPAPVAPAAEPGTYADAPSSPPPSDSQAEPDTRSRVQTQASAAVEGGRQTYREDDLFGAAEGVFGKGARGLAETIQGILKKQGEPNGYIVGREGGGAFVAGVRYGSGTLFHKVEGEQPVYWTGPSIGFDAGANVASAFVLVYNLYDTNDLYKRYVAGEGQAYLVGGFNVSYLRHGDVVLIPVRLGAGLRLGANVGYMRFSRTQRWLPF